MTRRNLGLLAESVLGYSEGVRIRWYIDPDTDEPHVLKHPVTLDEVEEAVAGVVEDRVGKDGSRVLIGRTEGGRFLRVIYVPDDDPDGIFVITAYPVGQKPLWALRRRLRRKR